MKKIIVERFGGPEVLQIAETERPEVAPDEVLIEVAKTSVNFADIKQRKGSKGKGKFPFTPGLDASGTIVSVGEEVTSLEPGQRVMAFPSEGSYAEYVTAKEVLTFPIHDEVDFSVAAACPTVSILSYKLLSDLAKLQAGERVLIHAAAGGVGTTAVQIAKLLGAGQVIGTVSNEEKFQAVKEAGADHVLLYDDFPEQVHQLTEGNGADIILDSIAGDITERSLDCLAFYGRLIHFGNSGGKAGNIQTRDLHSSCRQVLGYSLGTTRKKRPRDLQAPAQSVLKYIAEGKLDIKIGHEFPLAQAGDAHRIIESRKSIGKMLLSVKNNM